MEAKKTYTHLLKNGGGYEDYGCEDYGDEDCAEKIFVIWFIVRDK